MLPVRVDVPVTVCGTTAPVIGALNPALGNACANGDARGPEAGA
ncbi:chaplin [Streptomyces sp. NPDC004787]